MSPKLLIVQLMGGLGNQMFQYGLGRRLALNHQAEFKVDTSILLDHTPNRDCVNRTYDLDIFKLEVATASMDERRQFNPRGLSIPGKIAFHLGKPFLGQRVCAEKNFRYDETVVNRPTVPAYVSGLWQSYKYVEPIRNVLLRDFQFRHELPASSLELADALRQPQAVCLNVRRTDFVSTARTASTLGFVGLEYYKAAVSEMLRLAGDTARFFVFSDDLDWCRSELSWLPNGPFFVGHEFAGPKFSHYFRLMTLARNFVIPNSTFAWWAAWLSSASEKHVIAPRRWFRDPALSSPDLCPPDWVLV